MDLFEAYIRLKSLNPDLQKKALAHLDLLANAGNTKRKTYPKTAGLAKGLIYMKPSFDDPLEGFSPEHGES